LSRELLEEAARVCEEGLENIPTLLAGGEMTERRRAKVWAPAMVRKPPDVFILTFIIRGPCSA
jgi:hypothetical protein